MEKEELLRTSLNVKKDRFFVCFTALPSGFMTVIGVLGVIQPILLILLPLAIVWFLLFLYIGNRQRYEIVFYEDSFSIVQKDKETNIAFSQIVQITETIEEKPFDTTNYYTILLNEDFNSKELILANKKVQKNISKLFPNVPIKRRVLL